jgi:hypothetical protein
VGHKAKAAMKKEVPIMEWSRKVLQSVEQNNSMFGKAKCKLCGDNVRFVLRHLKRKHSDLYYREIARMEMAKIVEKYFT